MKNPDRCIDIRVRFDMPLWDAIKLRISGLWKQTKLRMRQSRPRIVKDFKKSKRK